MHRADWIAARLALWQDEYTITIVVPAGFEAYARVLHPAETPENGNRLVRWADVAAWSAMPLRTDVQFHSIALPPTAPGGSHPYGSQGPQEGSLYLPDAEVLAAIGRDWTAGIRAESVQTEAAGAGGWPWFPGRSARCRC